MEQNSNEEKREKETKDHRIGSKLQGKNDTKEEDHKEKKDPPTPQNSTSKPPGRRETGALTYGEPLVMPQPRHRSARGTVHRRRPPLI